MNFAICQNEQNLVDHLTLCLFNVGVEGLQYRSEEGWSSKLNVWKLVSIDLLDLMHALDARRWWVSIQSEAMVWLPLTLGDASESESWEVLIMAIRL